MTRKPALPRRTLRDWTPEQGDGTTGLNELRLAGWVPEYGTGSRVTDTNHPMQSPG